MYQELLLRSFHVAITQQLPFPQSLIYPTYLKKITCTVVSSLTFLLYGAFAPSIPNNLSWSAPPNAFLTRCAAQFSSSTTKSLSVILSAQIVALCLFFCSFSSPFPIPPSFLAASYNSTSLTAWSVLTQSHNPSLANITNSPPLISVEVITGSAVRYGGDLYPGRADFQKYRS